MTDKKNVWEVILESLQNIADSNGIKATKSEDELKKRFCSNLEQQESRDKATTDLYRQFVESHKEKQAFVKEEKKRILDFCIKWVSVFIGACVFFSLIIVLIILFTKKESAGIIALLSVIVPMVVAVIGMLTIVTKYVFPEDEEKNITEIVKAIHKNDLDNIRVTLGQQVKEDKTT